MAYVQILKSSHGCFAPAHCIYIYFFFCIMYQSIQAEILAKMHKVLLCITRLASATLSSLEPAQREDSVQDLKVEVPSSLHETAVILHGL